MLTSEGRSQNYQRPRRREVIVCENYREAREQFRQDYTANLLLIDSVRIHELTIDFKDGGIRRYVSGQHGIERVMGMEITSYHNLIRDFERFWEFEEILRSRAERYQEVTITNVNPEASTWTLIKNEWILFLSKPVGKLMLLFTVLLVILVILLLTQQTSISP
jgi:hypothetical protein